MARILGIDPGLQVTGYAVIETAGPKPRPLEAGVIRSAEGRDTSDMARRLKVLYDGIVEVMDQWSITSTIPSYSTLRRRAMSEVSRPSAERMTPASRGRGFGPAVSMTAYPVTWSPGSMPRMRAIKTSMG